MKDPSQAYSEFLQAFSALLKEGQSLRIPTRTKKACIRAISKEMMQHSSFLKGEAIPGLCIFRSFKRSATPKNAAYYDEFGPTAAFLPVVRALGLFNISSIYAFTPVPRMKRAKDKISEENKEEKEKDGFQTVGVVELNRDALEDAFKKGSFNCPRCHSFYCIITYKGIPYALAKVATKTGNGGNSAEGKGGCIARLVL